MGKLEIERGKTSHCLHDVDRLGLGPSEEEESIRNPTEDTEEMRVCICPVLCPADDAEGRNPFQASLRQEQLCPVFKLHLYLFGGCARVCGCMGVLTQL